MSYVVEFGGAFLSRPPQSRRTPHGLDVKCGGDLGRKHLLVQGTRIKNKNKNKSIQNCNI
jgi:hypothetical protein